MIDAALLLPKIMARAGDNAELNQVAAQIAWRRTVGEGLRDHAVPSQLQDKTLIVSVADAVWQKQLQLMSSELIFRVNKLLRRIVVERVEFRIDPRALKSNAAPTGSARVTTPLPVTVTSSAEGIQDEALRERFMRAASNCIARRENVQSASRIPQSEI